MSKRGYYLGGHTIIRGIVDWSAVRKKEKTKKRRRSNSKTRPLGPAVIKVLDETEWREAQRWAELVKPAEAEQIVKRSDLTDFQRGALLELIKPRKREEAKREEADAHSATKSWARGIRDIAKMLQRTTVSQTEREALIEEAVRRRKAAAKSRAKIRRKGAGT